MTVMVTMMVMMIMMELSGFDDRDDDDGVHNYESTTKMSESDEGVEDDVSDERL